MQDSLRTGLLAAFAVSGGVVLITMHAHNRLLSDFINKIEYQNKTSRGALKDIPRKKMMKKVRFTDDVATETIIENACVKKHRREPAIAACRSNGQSLEAMPQNWQLLYKGILQHSRNLRGYN